MNVENKHDDKFYWLPDYLSTFTETWSTDIYVTTTTTQTKSWRKFFHLSLAVSSEYKRIENYHLKDGYWHWIDMQWIRKWIF